VDFKCFPHNAVFNFAKNSELTCEIVSESFFKSLKNQFDQMYADNPYLTNDQRFFERFTISQLDKVKTLHPKLPYDNSFIGVYFRKVFHEELNQEIQDTLTLEEKRANLMKMQEYAKAHKMPRSLQSALLIEILELGIKLDQYDETLFK